MKKNYKTRANKLCALGLIVIGMLSIFPEKDITAFVILAIMAICLLFAKENVIDL